MGSNAGWDRLPSLRLGPPWMGWHLCLLTPNCFLFLHRASWVFLVYLATQDARVPR